jgi:DNA-binding FadR family transcriptional regulator
MDRRAAFTTIAAGTAATVVTMAPQLALADGAVSAATRQKARTVYGNRIYELKDAVDAGNFEAVAAEKSAFVLFNSGAYANDKTGAKQKAIEGTNAIFSAIKAGDKAALKTAYKQYVASNEITPLPKVDSQKGQGYSSDYDYRRGTQAGAIYVR